MVPLFWWDQTKLRCSAIAMIRLLENLTKDSWNLRSSCLLRKVLVKQLKKKNALSSASSCHLINFLASSCAVIRNVKLVA